MLAPEENKHEYEVDPCWHLEQYTDVKVVTVDEADSLIRDFYYSDDDQTSAPGLGTTHVIGLDAEWRPKTIDSPGVNHYDSANHVAVLQLSLPLVTLVILVHNIADGVQSFPKHLERMLGEPDILKVGVGVSNDARLLEKYFKVKACGFVELGSLLPRTSLPDELMDSSTGLARLCKFTLGIKLNKDKRIRCGNWEQRPLSEEQVLYAASDAYFGRQAFISMFLTTATVDEMNQHSFLQNHLAQFTVSREWFNKGQAKALTSSRKRFSWHEIKSWCTGIIDRQLIKIRKRHKRKETTSYFDQKTGQNTENGDVAGKQTREKESRLERYCRKSQMYDNVIVYSPELQFLCTCSNKKAKWYLKKDLAVIHTEDPFAIKLTFTPAGNGTRGDKYLEEKRDNMCVVCGAKDRLLEPGSSTGTTMRTYVWETDQPSTSSASLSSSSVSASSEEEVQTSSAAIEDKNGSSQGDEKLPSSTGNISVLSNVSPQHDNGSNTKTDIDSNTINSDSVDDSTGLVRFYIIPSMYRRHFPAELKSHNSHDILLLCASCHQQATLHSQHFSRQVLSENEIKQTAPLVTNEMKYFKRVRSAAKALANQAKLARIPSHRVAQLRAQVLEYLNQAESQAQKSVDPGEIEIDQKDLDYILSDEFGQKANPQRRSLESVGEKIVRRLIPSDSEMEERLRSQESLSSGNRTDCYHELHAFCTRWRQLFLDTMRPRHLSSNWKVDYRKPLHQIWTKKGKGMSK